MDRTESVLKNPPPPQKKTRQYKKKRKKFNRSKGGRNYDMMDWEVWQNYTLNSNYKTGQNYEKQPF